MQKVDLIIQDGTLCTMNPTREIKKSTSIVIHEGKIIDILGSVEAKSKYLTDNLLSGSDCIVLPGLVNTHTHSPLTFLRGISDDLGLMDWLTQCIWPIEKRFINEEFVYSATQLAIHEMVLSGTTTFNDSYFYSREVLKAAKAMGIRCVAGELLFSDPSPIRKTPTETLQYIEENIQEWKGDDLVTVSVAPHSLYACSPEIIKMAANLASKHDTLVNIFVSESEKEVDDIRKMYGASPVKVLRDLGVLNRNLVAAHCVHLSESDMDLLARNQVGVSHNPESNMKLGNGIAPIASLLRRGVTIGLGTDGAASNNDLSLLGEIDFAAKLQKGHYRDPSIFTSLQAVEMLTIEGAKVLKLDHKIGSIEIGKDADIILIDLKAPNMTPMYNPYSHIVYSANSSNIKTVVINGHIIANKGAMIDQSFEDIRETANENCSKIKAHLGI